MTAARSYKRAQTAVAAREELARCAGTQFDPVIVRAFLSISLGRMRLAMGPLAWVTQVPLFSELPRLANALQLVGSFFGAVGAAVMIGAPSLAEETAVEDVRSTRAIAATASEDSSEVTASEDPSEALKGAAPDVMPAVEPLPDPTPAADIPPLGELTFEVSLPAPAPQVPAQDPVPTTPEPPPPPEPASEPASPPAQSFAIAICVAV